MRRSRFLALHLPTLATDRLRRADPLLRGKPLATWATTGNRRLLTAVDAPGTTLRAGQALADAQAMHPDLDLHRADPEADRALLERLALWSLRLTPLAAVNPPDGLVLDIAGCLGPFGSEATLLAHAVDGVRRGGIQARAVVADVADAAGALARAGVHGEIVAPEGGRRRIAALSPSTLRLSADCLAGLHRLGIQTIGDALRQPRAPLSRRFGRELMDALDAATGDRPRPMIPVRPPPEFAVAEDHLDPVVTRPGIDLAIDRLLAQLCADLAAAGRGARRITLRAHRVDGNVQELTVGTGLPTRVPKHLRRLFAQVLERLEPDLGFERITLEASETNAFTADQDGLSTMVDDRRGDLAALAELFDRLRQRLSVWRLAPNESHWPERAVQPADPFSTVPRAGAWPGREHPVRLLRRPVPVAVLFAVPDGPPAHVRLDGAVHPVVWFDGPDHLEAEWWCEPEGRSGREYWRVALGDGSRLWLGRTDAGSTDGTSRWFLHGYLA